MDSAKMEGHRSGLEGSRNSSEGRPGERCPVNLGRTHERFAGDSTRALASALLFSRLVCW